MPIFKYTVANKENKKLSGTVEAPDEQTARNELNNLGFSILLLQKTNETPKIDKSLIVFAFEAIDKNSKLVSGTIPAKTEEDSYTKLTQEYALTVTAIWKNGATDEEISEARKKGTIKLEEKIQTENEIETTKTLEEQKESQFLKAKIELILKQVNDLLASFDKEFDFEIKSEISKRINKLLRIKQSSNLKYILSSAEELLEFIQSQEKVLKEKGHQEKRIELHIKTKELLDDLNKTSKPKTISEDIVEKIKIWEHYHQGKKPSATTQFIGATLLRIKEWFKTPIEIQVIKDQIKVYNKQLWEFAKLYFKEPTKEYKEKVITSLKTIWAARKKAIHSLTQANKLLKNRRKKARMEEQLGLSFLEELNSLTGWLLTFYLIYYFVSIYITTKNFGFTEIPKGFTLHESKIFKYILTILFLLHCSTTLKINFLKTSKISSFILPISFIFLSIIVLLNF